MRISLQTVICCCVFTTILPSIKGETEELSTTVKKRLKEWLQRPTRSGSHSSLIEPKSEVLVEPCQVGGGETPSLIPSTEANMRSKRSPSTHSGCFLVTCVVHDLVDRLHQEKEKPKKTCAPLRQMSKDGYGRRRRSLADIIQLAFLTGGREVGHKS